MQLELISSIDAERDNLGTHVDICAQRYSQLINKLDSVDQRFDRIETVLSQIQNTMSQDRTGTLKTYLAWSGVIIVLLLGTVGTLLTRYAIN
jgi:hypothetical protein